MNVMQSMPEEAVQLTLGETYPEIRDLVRRICSDFPGSYWRKLDDEEAYPSEFVAALTKAGLLAALIPEKIVLRGEIPSPARVPSGCAFHPRCYARIDGCDCVVPELITLGDGHAARCILYDPALGAPGLPNVIARRN